MSPEKYKDSDLCLQYRQLSQRHRETLELVNVKNITAKCVTLNVKKAKSLSPFHQMFLNTVEL